MALYQPSFMVPHNQTIDVTNKEDMQFKWQLNGNNLLCAYNIQIFDVDTNSLVYEIVSTENQRAIQENINLLTGYATNQENKILSLETYQTEYSSSTLKSQFKIDLDKDRTECFENYDEMAAIVAELKEEGRLTQTSITKYFQYWGNIIKTVQDRIGTLISSVTGDPVDPKEGTAEYIKRQIEHWMNVDPDRKDGIEYEGDVQLIEDTAFVTVKDTFSADYETYYNNVMTARREASASDTSYINDITLKKAKETILLMYSSHSDEMYYVKDLWEAVSQMWSQIDIEGKIDDCEEVLKSLNTQINQETYALAHLNGGRVTALTNAYSTTNAVDANLLYKIPANGEVAIIDIDPQPPTGWAYIIYGGKKAYIQTTNLQYFNIADGKYYLEKPVPPISYTGVANTVVHQLPTDALENGKSYKWSVTLYWSTSGKYNQDDLIDGHLTSIECYFDARKRPEVYLDNLKQLFSIPYNYVEVVSETVFDYEDKEGNLQTVELNVGDKVLFIHLDENDPNLAVIRYTTAENIEVQGIVEMSCLSGTGEYDPDRYFLYSKYATFIGGYKQEQYTSVSYFRWVLCKLQYDSEEVVEVVKDTGMIPSIDIRFYYDGFLNGEKYSIKLYVQTLDNVEVETPEYIFEVQYIDISIENMVNAENSPIEHGIIVEWSNLRLIQGEVLGGKSYTDDCPLESHTILSLDEGATLTFDKDKGKPLNIDWDTNHIISMRIDKDRPEDQIYFKASGLDDNGEVVHRTLELKNRPTTDMDGVADLVYTVHTAISHDVFTQEIIASPLYWYIIIMTTGGFTVYKKYADGLFPMRELYATRNLFTDSTYVVPLPLRYYDEPSERVNYNYQTIIRNDGTYRDEEV